MILIFDSTGTLTSMVSAAAHGNGQPVVRSSVGAGKPPEPPASAAPPSEGNARFQSAVVQANNVIAQSGLKLEFVVDKTLNRTIINVVDVRTKEVVQQVPAEGMLATVRALVANGTKGGLIDEQA